MRYYYDCEFLEDGLTIDLISIGIVAEDGREYYAVNSDMPVDRIAVHDWLCKNVVPLLPLTDPDDVRRQVVEAITGDKRFYAFPGYHNRLSFELDRRCTHVRPRFVIANEVRDLLLSDGPHPQLWARWGAYDHVALMQLWGPMVRKPDGLPYYTRDIEQVIDSLQESGRELELPRQDDGEHNALASARHNMIVAKYLDSLAIGGSI